MKRTLGWAAALILAAGVGAARAQEHPAPVAGLNLDRALQASLAAVRACKASGYTVAASVVDAAGLTKVLTAADGASKRAVETSTGKAVAAITFAMSSAEVGRRATTDPALAARLAADPRLVSHAGAILLPQGGALGVGGAPGGEKDEACATAGLEAIAGP